MAHKIIYSRFFLERVYYWSIPLKDMAFQAAAHAALDPHHLDYARPYLTPYKQKHPNADHQYTLFFEILSPSISIYFSWINDDTCLHTTRANYDDPCLKEFEKLRNSNQLESFDPKFHQIQFEVHPDKNKPIRCRSRYLGCETQVNTYQDSAGMYVAHSFNCNDSHYEISRLHISLFLNELHTHISNNNISFEFRIYKSGHQKQIDQLTDSHDPKQWRIINDVDDFIMAQI